MEPRSDTDGRAFYVGSADLGFTPCVRSKNGPAFGEPFQIRIWPSRRWRLPLMVIPVPGGSCEQWKSKIFFAQDYFPPSQPSSHFNTWSLNSKPSSPVFPIKQKHPVSAFFQAPTRCDHCLHPTLSLLSGVHLEAD